MEKVVEETWETWVGGSKSLQNEEENYRCVYNFSIILVGAIHPRLAVQAMPSNCAHRQSIQRISSM